MVQAVVVVVVGVVVAEVVAGQTAMDGIEVESAAAVEQTPVAPGPRRDRIGMVVGSEVAATGWPDARVVSVRTQLGTTSFGTVAVAVDLVVSVLGPGRWRYRCSDIVGRLAFRPGTGPRFWEGWRVM